MGQQQLLLLVLSIIIVGAAVVYAIQAFDENRLQAEQDAEVLYMLNLASGAQSWKSTPALMGGGYSNDPADFSGFTIGSLGLTATGGPDGSPYVDIEGAGCFRFFPHNDHLRINALDEDCVLGSWTKGIIVSGVTEDDLSWEYRTN